MITRAISQPSPYLLSAFSVPDSLLATGGRDADFLPSSNSFAQETETQTSTLWENGCPARAAGAQQCAFRKAAEREGELPATWKMRKNLPRGPAAVRKVRKEVTTPAMYVKALSITPGTQQIISTSCHRPLEKMLSRIQEEIKILLPGGKLEELKF